MLTEKRIQVYLPEKDYKSIKHRAQSEGKSIAQILREAATQYLASDSKMPIRPADRPPSSAPPVGGSSTSPAAPALPGWGEVKPRFPSPLMGEGVRGSDLATASHVDEPDDEWRAWQGLKIK